MLEADDNRPGAFLHYVRPLWRRLHTVARHHVATADDADELVQETLLRAWRAFAPSDERTYGRAWIFTILRHLVLEWQRTAARRVTLRLVSHVELTELAGSDTRDPLPDLPALSESAFCEFLDDRLARAFASLNPSFREVLLLSVVGELTYREIADVLDCPVGTVMSRMARSRRALRQAMTDSAVPRESRKGRI